MIKVLSDKPHIHLFADTKFNSPCLIHELRKFNFSIFQKTEKKSMPIANSSPTGIDCSPNKCHQSKRARESSSKSRQLTPLNWNQKRLSRRPLRKPVVVVVVFTTIHPTHPWLTPQSTRTTQSANETRECPGVITFAQAGIYLHWWWALSVPTVSLVTGGINGWESLQRVAV